MTPSTPCRTVSTLPHTQQHQIVASPAHPVATALIAHHPRPCPSDHAGIGTNNRAECVISAVVRVTLKVGPRPFDLPLHATRTRAVTDITKNGDLTHIQDGSYHEDIGMGHASMPTKHQGMSVSGTPASCRRRSACNSSTPPTPPLPPSSHRKGEKTGGDRRYQTMSAVRDDAFTPHMLPAPLACHVTQRFPPSPTAPTATHWGSA